MTRALTLAAVIAGGLWLMLALPGQGLAQTVAPSANQTRSAILTLDQDRLYTESLFGKMLEKTSADQVAKLATENHQIEAELASEEKALTEERASKSAADFKPLADAFDAKVEQIRADQEAKSKALQTARDAGRKKFFQSVLPVLAGLMRQHGALAILDKNAVILSFDTIDVTDAAIAAIDASLGDGTKAAAPTPTPTPAPQALAPDAGLPQTPAPSP